MTDKWSVNINDMHHKTLGKFALIPNDQELARWVVKLPECIGYFDTVPGIYVAAGVAVEALIYKNGWTHAEIKYFSPEYVVFGQLEDRPIFLVKDQLIDKGKPVDTIVRVCTCGVKFTGGLCSDWCDLVRNV